jgi:hypothetical protein
MAASIGGATARPVTASYASIATVPRKSSVEIVTTRVVTRGVVGAIITTIICRRIRIGIVSVTIGRIAIAVSVIGRCKREP